MNGSNGRSSPTAERPRRRAPLVAAALAGAIGLMTMSAPAKAAGLLVADGGLGGVLAIEEHDVDVTINNGIAVTSVTQVFRNSPWLVLLFCIMLLFPFEIDLGFAVIPIPDWVKAVIGFSLPIMANISEVVRGAVQSIPTGQWESSESLAFTRRQTMWMIILPQCIKRMIPPWINWYCILAMATPLCSIMGVEESVTHTVQALNAEGD